MKSSETPIELEPIFKSPAFALALRPAFARTTPRSLSLPGALGPAALSRLRRLARAHAAPFTLADRGRYRFADILDTPIIAMRTLCAPLLAELRDFAEVLGGQPLRAEAGSARILFFSRGDYSLRYDDARLQTSARALEATLDLSPKPGEPTATIYREGRSNYLALAQLPGQLSLVERGPHTTRYDRYRSALTGSREFVLLRATFPLAES